MLYCLMLVLLIKSVVGTGSQLFAIDSGEHHVSLENKTKHSDLFLVKKTECTYKIKAVEGKVVKIIIGIFQSAFEACPKSNLRILDSDGKQMHKQSICPKDGNTTLTTSSNHAQVIIKVEKSSNIIVNISFEAIWSPACKKCGHAGKHVPKTNLVYEFPYVTVSNKSSWPWHSAIVYKESNEIICQGSIISEKFVLTASHCLDELNFVHFEVVFGKFILNVNDTDEQRIAIKTVHYPPGRLTIVRLKRLQRLDKSKFNEFETDIALIELTDEIEFNPHIRPVCLPTLQPFPGEVLMATGWHIRKNYVEALIDVMDLSDGKPKEMKVILASFDLCETVLKISKYSSKPLGGSMCSRTTQFEDSVLGSLRAGDSGGPLVRFIGNKWELVGVFSSGLRLTTLEQYGIDQWTSVHFHLKWIQNVMKMEGLTRNKLLD